MIRVCDAIMGSGKTESAITYINEHPDKKFIYITPYLDEARRIKNNCPDARFAEPSAKLRQYEFRKLRHIEKLIRDGRNITSTHSAFRRYTPDMLAGVRDKGYTLIIDETLDILQEIRYDNGDIALMVKAGYVRWAKRDGVASLTMDGCEPIPDGMFSAESNYYDLLRVLRTKKPMTITDEGATMLVWSLPTDFVSAFEDVIIMTYMIEGQELGCYLKANGFQYKKIGVSRDESGVYRFGEYNEYIPSYVKTLPDMIHIVDHVKLNRIGKENSALSMNWFSDKVNRERAANSVYYLKKYLWGSGNDQMKTKFMWGTYKSQQHIRTSGGFKKSFLVFNARATNDYRDKDHLAYMANVYLNVGHKVLFQRLHAPIDEEAYALSTMIQWIWRSAIRDGKEIWLYVPSSRMRTLLTEWIDEVSKGGVADCAERSTNAATAESAARVRPQMSPADASTISPLA